MIFAVGEGNVEFSRSMETERRGSYPIATEFWDLAGVATSVGLCITKGAFIVGEGVLASYRSSALNEHKVSGGKMLSHCILLFSGEQVYVLENLSLVEMIEKSGKHYASRPALSMVGGERFTLVKSKRRH